MKKLSILFAAMFMAVTIISCDKVDKKDITGFKPDKNVEVASIEYASLECEWVGETAWTCGDEFTERGNWATYVDYWRNMNSAVNNGKDNFYKYLIAGRTRMRAGLVNFSYPDATGKVKVKITLYSGWRFEQVEENVKAQDYKVAPSGNVAPGKFAYKFFAENLVPNIFVFYMPANDFYAVHAEVEWEKCE